MCTSLPCQKKKYKLHTYHPDNRSLDGHARGLQRANLYLHVVGGRVEPNDGASLVVVELQTVGGDKVKVTVC